MDSPSGSEAVTLNDSRACARALAVAGAVTTGGCGWAKTVIAVGAEPESALPAVKVTV